MWNGYTGETRVYYGETVLRSAVGNLTTNDLINYAAGIKDSEKKIQTLLKAYIGRNLLDDPAFYPIYHEVDKIFLIALDTIRK